MKKTEKIISALASIVFGVLLIILRGDLISVLMTALGVGLIVIGVIDLINKQFPPAIVKAVCGVVVIVCGWVIVSAVLYILAGVLLIAGILLLYEQIKSKTPCGSIAKRICEFATPVILIVIGILLMFNQGNTMNWVFIIGGVLTVVEGGVLLTNALTED